MGTRLQNKTALVTGSTSNIGRAIAVAVAAEGAHVVVSGRSAERGAEVVEEIRSAGGRADFVAADLDGTSRASRTLAEEATRALGGRIDILVNNVGVTTGGASTPDTTEADLDLVYAVNVKAPFFLTAAIAPAMAEAGGGAVINLGSWVARLGIPVGSGYAATKGALETLTRAWSAEFGSRGVRVNGISPGVVRAPEPGGTGPHPAATMMNGTPAGAIGMPDAVAHAAVYLAGDEASFVHGTVIDVDGGRVGVAVISAA
ncbi:SDR family NAD(P)-dependent oxidoreductase [Streptomyces sp. NPDC051217]|uniref:SDR family NAD(P)-dependent oxidoreductase n=1 Tax=Streptomyces sp. NPDC051217 TaxID=3365644 RepID=UPI00379725BE